MFVCICVYIKGSVFFYFTNKKIKNLVIWIRVCNWLKLKYYFSKMCFIWIVKWNYIFHKENNLNFIFRGNCYVTPIIWQTNKPVCWWVGPPKQDDVGWLSIFYLFFFCLIWVVYMHAIESFNETDGPWFASSDQYKKNTFIKN